MWRKERQNEDKKRFWDVKDFISLHGVSRIVFLVPFQTVLKILFSLKLTIKLNRLTMCSISII